MNAIYYYRIARWFFLKGVPVFPTLIKGMSYLIFNSVIPYTCIIGAGSRFAYGGIGVVVHGKAVLGENVIIGQGVTIGRQLDPEGVPVIGSNVYISAGARILGGITIGDNVIVGANSVVIRDVPSNCIVAGVPARVIRVVNEDIYALLKNIYQ
jgi:serine O-acetyltransferase